MSISTDDLNKAGKQHHQKMPPARTIWMRYTTKAGKSHVMEHLVWDKELFLSSRASDAQREGGKAEQITEDDYRSGR